MCVCVCVCLCMYVQSNVSNKNREESHDVVFIALDCDILVSEFELSPSITFTFGLIPLGNILIHLSPNYWLKGPTHCCFFNVVFDIK